VVTRGWNLEWLNTGRWLQTREPKALAAKLIGSRAKAERCLSVRWKKISAWSPALGPSGDHRPARCWAEHKKNLAHGGICPQAHGRLQPKLRWDGGIPWAQILWRVLGADWKTDATIEEIESLTPAHWPTEKSRVGIVCPWCCLEWSEGESSVGLASRRKIRLALWPWVDRENKNLGGERQATAKKPIEREPSLGEEITPVQILESRLKVARWKLKLGARKRNFFGQIPKQHEEDCSSTRESKSNWELPLGSRTQPVNWRREKQIETKSTWQRENGSALETTIPDPAKIKREKPKSH
jgi:hypothetical protein